MKKMSILLCIFMVFQVHANAQIFTLKNVKCDYRINPIGVDQIQPHFAWQLQSNGYNIVQIAYQIIVSDDSVLLQKNIGNIWDSKKQLSNASIQVTYQGKKLEAAKKYYWKVKVWDNQQHFATSAIQYWQMGLFSQSDWLQAKWIGYNQLPDSLVIVPHADQGGKKVWGKRKDILPLLRTHFIVSKKVQSATLFISGLGHFELHINGKKTGDHILDPGWTNYTKEAQYVAFDVKKQIRQGENALGVQLGNGFYYIPSERYRKITGGFGYPKMICRLMIQYADGSVENIVSNEQWKTAPSPIIFSSMYGGEDYDATLEQNGWDNIGFNDKSWQNAIVVQGHPLHLQTQEPVKIMETFTSIEQNILTDSVCVFDLGQNFSGIPEIKVQGKRGDTIKIYPSELLKADGFVNQKASGSPHYYTYILKGNQPETWHPSFTYYGLRYVQVVGAVTNPKNNIHQLPVLLALKGLHIRNSATNVGSFQNSNTLFNKTEKLIDWAIKSNMVSVLTDCPHREKLGWLEQTYLMGNSLQYKYDIATLIRKMLNDMGNAQTSNGLIPEIAPEFVQFPEPFRDSPEWGTACIILPWYAYQWYGDIAFLTEYYTMMQHYMGYLQSKDSSRILSQGLGDWYDLGPGKPGFSQLTPQGLTATATYYYVATIMHQIATILQKKEEAASYKKLSTEIKAAFNTKFFHAATQQYGTGSQTSNAMALYLGLVDPANQKAVVNNLVASIQNNNFALTAGDIGFHYVLKALDQAGRSDIIFKMNNRSDVPGYGYQLAQRATALTESWQALPTVSNNHFMLGHIMEWFYEGLAGIQQATNSIGYQHIIIRPQIVGDIQHANAKYQSAYGLIASDWTKSDIQFTLHVTIPANSNATVCLPSIYHTTITKNGKPIPIQDAYEIGSGDYTFIVK
jgi:hypothetical protein